MNEYSGEKKLKVKNIRILMLTVNYSDISCIFEKTGSDDLNLTTE